jgi:hypothetical protein
MLPIGMDMLWKHLLSTWRDMLWRNHLLPTRSDMLWNDLLPIGIDVRERAVHFTNLFPRRDYVRRKLLPALRLAVLSFLQ